MPGAPNRPPEIDAPPAPVALVPDDPAKRVLRRLGPARVALKLDLWKGAPARELADPLVRADARYAAGDIVNAQSDLDQLAVRFAEPRWPTMPTPFRQLRVAIPAPMPPSWDPDFSLPPPEREAKRMRREAEFQRDLAEASVLWASAHQFPVPDGAGRVERAKAALANPGVGDAFWVEIDAIWESIRAIVPLPGSTGKPAASPASEAA